MCKDPYCGDGYVDRDGRDNDIDKIEDNEACDDGNNVPGDNCDEHCQLEIDPMICTYAYSCPE